MIFTLATLAGSVMRCMSISVLRRSRAVLLVLMLWLLSPSAAIAFAPTLFIDQARHQPDAAAVIVTGVVTVPSGLFASANGDQGFAIQDPTGGIYIHSEQTIAGLQVGDTVQVRGVLQDDGHNQRILRLQEWHLSGRPFPPVTPPQVTLQVAGRHLDGQLVTVQGQITRPLKDDAPYGDRLWIADDTQEIQIYIPKSTQIDPQSLTFLRTGHHIQVTGLSSQYDDNDEVIPRTRADIVEASILF